MLIGRVLTALSLVAALLSGLPSSALDSEGSRATLKGLRGVSVTVEEFQEAAKRAGFDERTFQTDIELRLRMAGIKVLSQSESLESPGMPSLYFNVATLHERPNEIVAYSINIELNQMAMLARHPSLVRDPSLVFPVTTWSTGGIRQGHIPYIRQHAKDLTDRFVNAWLSVNPKE